MYADLPVAQLLSVALATEFVRLLKVHGATTGEVQSIAVEGVVTLVAPSIIGAVVEGDGRVGILERSGLGIYVFGIFWIVAIAAREDVRREGRRHHLSIFVFRAQIPSRRKVAVVRIGLSDGRKARGVLRRTIARARGCQRGNRE